MIKTTPHKIAILMGILLSPSVFATDINVEFTATVKATTCNITLTGNNVTNDGNNNYTLRIPKMGLDKIANKTTESQADFKLVASGCSSGISWIDTTLTGNASSSSPKLPGTDSGRHRDGYGRHASVSGSSGQSPMAQADVDKRRRSFPAGKPL